MCKTCCHMVRRAFLRCACITAVLVCTCSIMHLVFLNCDLQVIAAKMILFGSSCCIWSTGNLFRPVYPQTRRDLYNKLSVALCMWFYRTGSVCVCLMFGILDVALCHCTCYSLFTAHSFTAADKRRFFPTGLRMPTFIREFYKLGTDESEKLYLRLWLQLIL